MDLDMAEPPVEETKHPSDLRGVRTLGLSLPHKKAFMIKTLGRDYRRPADNSNLRPAPSLHLAMREQHHSRGLGCSEIAKVRYLQA
jgi:hypothetical protein